MSPWTSHPGGCGGSLSSQPMPEEPNHAACSTNHVAITRPFATTSAKIMRASEIRRLYPALRSRKITHRAERVAAGVRTTYRALPLSMEAVAHAKRQPRPQCGGPRRAAASAWKLRHSF